MRALGFGKSGFLIARLVTTAFALATFSWLLAAVPVISSQAAIADIATHILAGETYKPETMEALTAAVDRGQGGAARGSYLNRVAVIRLRNAENAAKTGGQGAVDTMVSLRKALDLSLANSPDDPFLWLVRFWTEDKTRGVTPAQLNLLRMSYRTGPREGWIAAKRNGLALAVFPQLPPDLAELVLAEFVGLISSGFYIDAANIVAGPGWPVRKQLLARLVDVKDRDRKEFARILYAKDVEDVVVPGVEPPAPRPFRP